MRPDSSCHGWLAGPGRAALNSPLETCPTSDKDSDKDNVAVSAKPGSALASSVASIGEAIGRTRDWLLSRQNADGHWCAELEGDTILESEYILLLAWLGREDEPVAHKAARYMLTKQLPEGGWSLYPGGKMEISASVKAYFALKLTGHDADAPYMCRAREAILAHGGADAVNSFTRFYLALLGQISYDHCPAVPPEMVLLPKRAPISIYRISSWSRTIVVPLAIMWAYRPVKKVADSQGIRELFLTAPEQWGRLQCPGLDESTGLISWGKFFTNLDHNLKWFERWKIRPFRALALRRAERWMTRRFAGSDGLGAIFPPIIWSLVALKCRGFDDQSPEVRYCHEQLEGLMLTDGDTVRLQPCKSPVWDTSITLRALHTTRSSQGSTKIGPSIDRATRWLLSKEATRRGDWAANTRCEPGGWFFEHNNEHYPDLDDTAMVLMALQECGDIKPDAAPLHPLPEDSIYDQMTLDAMTAASKRAIAWTRAMQNRDGGWGAFDRNNDSEFLCHVPFADHNAMIDPSTPDLAARVLEALGCWGITRGDKTVDRAITYVQREQEPDGSWFGRWGVNYIYGTWQSLVGLTKAGVPAEDPSIERGAEWFLDHQLPCGGWGETPETYDNPALRGSGPATASQTAWALLGLIAAGYREHQATARGIEYLLQTQNVDGSWNEEQFTGTGFPRVFYLKYHYYPVYFPLMALATYAQDPPGLTSNSSKV